MKGFKAKIRKYKTTRWILIITNWASQGIWHLDKTEKIYRISFTLICTFIVGLILKFLFQIDLNIHLIALSFFIGHTINWIVNSNLFTLFVHRLLIGKTTKEDFFNYMHNLTTRAEKEDSIIGIYCFGSLSRGELKERSDLDISFLRKTGLLNAFRSIIFFTKEKKISQALKVPTESFLCDKVSCLKLRYSKDELPVIVYDKNKAIMKNYVQSISLDKARKMNIFI